MLFLLALIVTKVIAQNTPASYANIVTAILQQNSAANLTVQCRNGLANFTGGLKRGDEWAVKMFNAGAKLHTRYNFDENVHDFGYFDQCIELKQPETDIVGQYCLGEMNYTVTQNISRIYSNKPVTGHLGVCFPNVCSSSEIEMVYHKMGIMMEVKEISCQTMAGQYKAGYGSIATLFLFGCIIFIVLLSTAYDIILYYAGRNPDHILFTAFSVLTNGKQLLKFSNKLNEISCLHGIRVISLLWIICFHVFFIQINHPTRNFGYTLKWYKNPLNMYMIAGIPPVDTFFLLSGLLVSYNFLRANNKGIKLKIIPYYVHRYIRLTSVLIPVLLVHVSLVKLMGSGPIWPAELKDEMVGTCESNWWYLLLYIQNLVAPDQCVPVTWYLSVDMQYFILSPLILLPLAKWSKITLGICALLTFVSMLICFLFAWIYQLLPYVTEFPATGKDHYFMSHLFYQPYSRASAWLIGIILGYFLFQSKTNNWKIPTYKNCFTINFWIIPAIWIISLAVLAICVFGGYDLLTKDYNRLGSSFHVALVRPIWAITISGIIFMCANGNGGMANWFLSLQIFRLLSKLNYSIYVVHYMVIWICTVTMRVTTVTSMSTALFQTWGYFALSLAVSLILWITIEIPFITIAKYYIQ